MQPPDVINIARGAPMCQTQRVRWCLLASTRSPPLSDIDEPERSSGGVGSLIVALVLGAAAAISLVVPMPRYGQLLQALAPYVLALAGVIAAIGVVRARRWARLRNFGVAFALLAAAVVLSLGGSGGADRRDEAWTLLIWNVEGATLAEVEGSLAALSPDIVILTETGDLDFAASAAAGRCFPAPSAQHR